MKSQFRLGGVSDVSVGYGSPEVLMLMNSLAHFYQTPAILFEPDEISRPLISQNPFTNVVIQRIPSSYVTYSHPFRIDYISRVAAELNRHRPALLVLFCTFSLPVLLKLKYRPRFVLYHCYEMVSKYGSLDIEINRQMAKCFNLITFPEENRARIDTDICGFHRVPKAVLYNCADLVPSGSYPALPAMSRNGRFIYYGTIDRQNALSDYFLDPRLQGLSIDLFGRLQEPSEQERNRMLAGFRGTVRYHGLLEADKLVELRRHYAFSIILWNPKISDNHLYAAPNRLFTSIQAGVPPIAAPHPQCRQIIRRYDCGILMKDWSFEAFYQALHEGMRIYGTSRYADMVNNCLRATEEELNWAAQFEKIRRFLPDRL